MATDTLTPAPVRRAIDRAIAERDAGIARAEASDLLGWDRALMAQAIDVFAERGHPFSANNLRPLLPDIEPHRIGAGFIAAVMSKRIVRVGQVRSTSVPTHNRKIGLYIGAAAQAALVRRARLEASPDPIVAMVGQVLFEYYGPVTTPAGALRRRRIGERISIEISAAIS